MTKVSDLFTLKYGHSLELNAQAVSSGPDAVNFVSRTARNNGVSARIAPVQGLDPAPAGTVSVALGGQGGAGVAFLQPFPYYCGRDVMILAPKIAMSEPEALWWVTCITANRFRFGFGRQANKTLGDLPLPDNIPSWAGATNLNRFNGAKASASSEPPLLLVPGKWADFRYDKIFDIRKGYYNKKPPLSAAKAGGALPFIGATDSNNGITSYHRLEDIAAFGRNGEADTGGTEKKIFPPNCITVSNNGSVGYAFFQPVEFTCSHDVNPLYLLEMQMTPEIGMFLCTVIGLDRYRWGYGRKWRPMRMPHSILRLPVLTDGKPDWKYMERYIRALPYSKAILEAA